jgi:cobalt/nickel transport protein
LNTKHYVILIIAVVALFVSPLILLPEAEFSGSDSVADQAISDLGHKPWFSPIWTPPSGEIETLLFSLQAAIGAIIIGYFIGYERGKRAQKETKERTQDISKIG